MARLANHACDIFSYHSTTESPNSNSNSNTIRHSKRRNISSFLICKKYLFNHSIMSESTHCCHMDGDITLLSLQCTQVSALSRSSAHLNETRLRVTEIHVSHTCTAGQDFNPSPHTNESTYHLHPKWEYLVVICQSCQVAQAIVQSVVL